ncbi:MAG: cellulose synthase operon protein YhjQ/BcsQ [Zymomonas mobilis]|uniref:MinD-like ATPase involved in chromosome partitioning or flagellar assembly n=1 Tax=Zymomonas mobilis TaxID=542 RepID=A0A542W1M7_ZYMMB|nr:cellulose synthase operon protein YhjQ/BcsQ [Zymomonas mobilis]TQL17468.1 MinD-like ATPase involved in chromosome partitioning or flagellar assembly [Zymomonas mobilis]
MLVLFHSFKGGVGVSTVAANIALSLARFHQKVAIADLTRQQSLNFHIGIQEEDIPFLSSDNIEELYNASKEFEEDGGIVIADIGTEIAHHTIPEENILNISIISPNAGCMALFPEAFDKKHYYIINNENERYNFSRAASQFVQDMVQDNLIGIIRQDEAVNEALGKLQPLNLYQPESAALKDFNHCAHQLLRMIGINTSLHVGEVADAS